jgi:uncharacterized membrane protein
MSYLGDQRLEIAMGRLLQIGVTVAAMVVLVGGLLYLKHSTGPLPNYQQFHGAPTAYEFVHGILGGLGRFDSQSLIAFGILLLIATPICRVIFGVVGFSLLRDRFYAAVSVTVLIILILSLVSRR